MRINDRDRKCSLVVGLIMVREKMLGVGSNMLRTENVRPNGRDRKGSVV